MEVKMKVISREMITPSSPTPNHLKSYKLSFLDQINPPVFMPLVLFYPLTGDHAPTTTTIFNSLKKSLSETLTLYYPLAGHVVDNTYVNCNDSGVTVVEARANCNLLDIIIDPIPGEFNKFLPCDLDDVRDLCMVIQFTLFECGGIAVGIGISHKIADAWSCLMFLNSWAATSRGGGDGGCVNVLSPNLISASIFPPKDVSGYSPKMGMVKKDEIISKRFVFTASKISLLTEKYTKNGGKRRPTRIQALSAFIWTRFMLSSESKNMYNTKIYTLLHAVNMRTRINDPPSPENYFGNFSRPAIAVPSLGDDEEESGYEIVEKMREAIDGLCEDYVDKLRREGAEGHLNFLKERSKDVIKGEVVSFSFTSLCKFPLYEADFGWGKPVWVGSARLGFKNLVVFLDSISIGDIEAWVNLKKEDMVKFEVDEQLLTYIK